MVKGGEEREVHRAASSRALALAAPVYEWQQPWMRPPHLILVLLSLLLTPPINLLAGGDGSRVAPFSLDEFAMRDPLPGTAWVEGKIRMISPCSASEPHDVNVLFENGLKARLKLAYSFMTKDVMVESTQTGVKIGKQKGFEKRVNAGDVLFTQLTVKTLGSSGTIEIIGLVVESPVRNILSR